MALGIDHIDNQDALDLDKTHQEQSIVSLILNSIKKFFKMCKPFKNDM